MILGIPSKDLHMEIVKGPNGIDKPIQTAFGNGVISKSGSLSVTPENTWA